MMLGQCYPNITGAFYIAKAGYVTNGSYATGAFSYRALGIGNESNRSNNGGTTIDFNAESSNSTYSGNTIQVPSCQILIIIKVWRDGGWTVFDAPYFEFDAFAEKLT